MLFVCLNSLIPVKVEANFGEAMFYGTEFLDHWLFIKGSFILTRLKEKTYKINLKDKYIEENIERLSRTLAQQQLDCFIVSLGNLRIEIREKEAMLTKILDGEKQIQCRFGSKNG